MRKLNENNIKTSEQLDAVLKKMAILQNYVDQQETEMNIEINEVKEKYEKSVSKAKKKLAENEADVEKYLISNKSKFVKPRKKAYTFGEVGFKKIPNKLGLLRKTNTWDAVTEKVFDLFADKFVTVKKILEKNVILKELKSENITEDQLKSCGIKVIKEEVPTLKLFKDKIELPIENAK